MMKECRVYYLDPTCFTTNISTSIIDSWYEQEELCAEAKIFIQIAEEKGNVYSLPGFVNALNSEEFNNCWYYCFITHKY